MEFSFKKAIKNRIEGIKAINLFHNNFKVTTLPLFISIYILENSEKIE
jgi:hypothetical protein